MNGFCALVTWKWVVVIYKVSFLFVIIYLLKLSMDVVTMSLLLYNLQKVKFIIKSKRLYENYNYYN